MSLASQLTALTREPPSVATFDKLLDVYRSIANKFRHEPDTHLALLRQGTRSIDKMARQVDRAVGGKACHEKWIQEAYNLFNFAALREEGNAALLLLGGILLQIYFRLRMFKSCERVVAAVEEAPKTAKTLATKAERVTYAYYYGRYLLNQCQMVEAADVLQEAFFRCHRAAYKNKRRILIFLTVASIMTDSAPNLQLLKKYRIKRPFHQLIVHMRRGNLAGYNRALLKFNRWHARYGNLLILQHYGLQVVYRHLFRRVHILAGLVNEKQPRLTFDVLRRACDLSAGDSIIPKHNDDEIVSLLSEMIAEKQLRGYIALPHRLLVTARGPASSVFPTLRPAPTRARG